MQEILLFKNNLIDKVIHIAIVSYCGENVVKE